MALTAKKLYSFVQTNKAYSLRFSPQVSGKFKQEVKQYLKESGAQLSTSNISSSLESQFGPIKTVVAQKSNPAKCHLKINCFNPLVKVRDKFFAEDGNLYSSDIFNNCSVPEVAIRNLDEVHQPEFKSFVNQTLDSQIFEQYSIEWVTKNQIILKHKENGNFNFLTKHNRLPEEKDVELIENFIGEKKGSKGHARADLRFAGQVIISLV